MLGYGIVALRTTTTAGCAGLRGKFQDAIFGFPKTLPSAKLNASLKG